MDRLVGSVADDLGQRTPFDLVISVSPRAAQIPSEFGDGRDAGPELGAWLTTQKTGAVDFRDGMPIRVERRVKVLDPVSLDLGPANFYRTVESEDPAYFYPQPNPFLWLLRPSGTWAVRGLKVRGTNLLDDHLSGGRVGYGSYLVKREFDAALRVEQATGLGTIADLDINGVWGDGYQLQVVNGVTVLRSRIGLVGRQVATLIGQNIRCDGDVGTHPRRSMYDIELDTANQVAGDIDIGNFVCGHVEQDAQGKDIYLGSIGIPVASAGKGSPSRVNIHHGTTYGATSLVYCKSSDGARRQDWTITDLESIGNPFGSPSAPIFLVNVDGAAVKRVKRSISKYKAGVYSQLAVHMRGCGGQVEISGNQFPVIGWDGKPVPDSPWYRDETSLAGRTLVVADNTPALTLAA